MPTIALSGHTAPNLACPPHLTEAVYWSSELPGFGLRCRKTGGRSWFVQYRTKEGVTRKHVLGAPETVPFARAFREAGRLLASARLGGDPAGDVKRDRGTIKVGELVHHYVEHQKPRMKVRSFVELARHLEKHAKPLHGQPAGKVTQRAIVELLQGIARTAPVTANRVRASLSAMFAWGMKAGLVTANPVAATFKPSAETSRERVLTDGELVRVWGATGGAHDYDRIVRLLLLTGARREEVAGLAWSELTHNDDGTVTWLLPSARSKNRLPHERVLPAMAAAILPARRDGRPLAFGEGDGPFSGWSRCKARLDARIAERGDGPVPAWVLHDLRRTVVTRLNEMGVEPHVVEALVNHASGSAKAGVAGVYNRSAYSAQKRAALTLWCDHVACLVSPADGKGAAPANVVPLRRVG